MRTKYSKKYRDYFMLLNDTLDKISWKNTNHLQMNMKNNKLKMEKKIKNSKTRKMFLYQTQILK